MAVRRIRGGPLGILLVAGVLAATMGIGHLMLRPPSLDGREASSSAQLSPATRLGRMVLAMQVQEAGPSGVLPLLDGPQAFAARVALIRAADEALDVQYYIWHRDTTGLILLEELRQAAARGVRVRLLLDDNGIHGMDADLGALDALPGIEVRLFNPFMLRGFKPLGYVFDFTRLNRRMHNKSLTADGAMSILGGRNIGDVYFGFGGGVQFLDTDLLVAGEAAGAISRDFDAYWHSDSAHPVARIVDGADVLALPVLIDDARRAAESPEGRGYFERLAESGLAQQLRSGNLPLEWTEVTVISDDPAKGLGRAVERDLLFPQLIALVSRPTHSVDLVSAYFIPGREFADGMSDLARNGVRVRILTNSQVATDVVLVHSAYARYRKRLLRAGVNLLELKPEFSPRDDPGQMGLGGSSSASLHSKVIGVDGQRIFVGSYNFDPRSLFLNTEMGVLVDSPRLAAALGSAFDSRFEQMSYKLVLDAHDELVWVEGGAEPTHYAAEPGTGVLSRLAVKLLGKLPIESLL